MSSATEYENNRVHIGGFIVLLMAFPMLTVRFLTMQLTNLSFYYGGGSAEHSRLSVR